jgi:hypothetical protein
MKKVVSVVGTPIRAIGRLLLKLLGKLRLLGALRTPLVKLSKLRGKALAIALAPILVVVILLVIALRPEPDQEEKVRDTLDRYEVATRDKDYQTLCDDLFAADLVERTRNAGVPCEVALRIGLEDRRNPRLTVLTVEVNGDEALARARSSAVDEPTSVDVIRLVREDADWRIASLQQPGAGAALPRAVP